MSAEDRLKRQFSHVHGDVVHHIFVTVCGGNFDIARDTLGSLSEADLRGLAASLGVGGVAARPRPAETLTPQQAGTVGDFRSITGVSQPVAIQFLKRTGWNLEGAMNAFFESGQTFAVDFAEVAPEPEKVEEKKPIPMDTPGLYDKTNQTRARLHRVSYVANVTDYFQTTTLSRTYINGSPTPVEMICVFSAGSAVHKLTIEFFDPETGERRRVRAEAVGKQEGRERYDDGIAEGNVVGLLEKKEVSERLVTLQLGNVKSGMELTVISESVQEVRMVVCEDEDDDDEEEELEEEVEEEVKMFLECTIPAVLNVDEDEDTMEVRAEGLAVRNASVWFGIRVSQGEVVTGSVPVSPSHPEIELVCSSSETPRGTLVTVRPSQEHIALTRDFTVRICVRGYPVATCLLQALPTPEVRHVVEDRVETERTYSHVAMLCVVPRNGLVGVGSKDSEEKMKLHDLAVMSEMILVVDCSGSMSGSRIRHARDAGKLFLQSLDPNDQINLNLVRFGSTHESLFRRPQALTPATFERAMRYIDDTKSNLRQTDILTPLKMVLETPTQPGYSRQVFLLTDGEDENSLKIVKMAKEHCAATRVFTLGIGNEINTFLIRELAAATNAKCTFLTKSVEIRGRVMEQLTYAVQPSVRDLQVKFDTDSFGHTDRVSRMLPPWIYANQRLVDYFYLERVNEEIGPVSISYAAGPVSRDPSLTPQTSVDIVPSVVSGDEVKIPVLAASRKIEELQLFGRDKRRDKAEIKRLALTYNLLSSETSFVCVSESEVEIGEDLKVEKVAAVPYAGTEGGVQLQGRDRDRGGHRFWAQPQAQAAAPPQPERYRSLAPMRPQAGFGAVAARVLGHVPDDSGSDEDDYAGGYGEEEQRKEKDSIAKIRGLEEEAAADGEEEGEGFADEGEPTSVVRAPRQGAQDLKGLKRQMGGVDAIEDQLDDVREMMQDANEISEALDQSIGGADTGDTDLMDELDMLEQETLEHDLSKTVAFSGTHGEDWAAKGTESATTAFTGTHGEDWQAKETASSAKAFVGTAEKNWVQLQPSPVSTPPRSVPGSAVPSLPGSTRMPPGRGMPPGGAPGMPGRGGPPGRGMPSSGGMPRPPPGFSPGFARGRGRGRGASRGGSARPSPPARRGPSASRGGGGGWGAPSSRPMAMARRDAPKRSSKKRRRKQGGAKGKGRFLNAFRSFGSMEGESSRSSRREEEEEFEDADEDDDISALDVEAPSLDEKLLGIEGGDLEKIMYMQELDGRWPAFPKFVSTCLHLDAAEVKAENPLGEDSDEQQQSLWITAIVIAILKARFQEESVQWGLIAKKASKTLKRLRVFRRVMSKARAFVAAH